ncbi:hypothetical protein L484_006004 [Morus notabilis]|uniref:Uncharacterized protein n=1 Tax=Morus notabilis TaxID=981085 RepID=W9RCD6_9ROSA|nr:hypothetical protein L484_006004 [Morus notabilis]
MKNLSKDLTFRREVMDVLVKPAVPRVFFIVHRWLLSRCKKADYPILDPLVEDSMEFFISFRELLNPDIFQIHSILWDNIVDTYFNQILCAIAVVAIQCEVSEATGVVHKVFPLFVPSVTQRDGRDPFFVLEIF